MKHLTIKRSEWLRYSLQDKKEGKFFPTSLLDEENKRCCMGFDAHYVCGIEDALCLEHSLPSEMEINHLADFKLYRKYFKEFWDLESLLAAVNDRDCYNDYEWVNTVSDEEQEKIITRLYSLVNYKVEFVD